MISLRLKKNRRGGGVSLRFAFLAWLAVSSPAWPDNEPGVTGTLRLSVRDAVRLSLENNLQIQISRVDNRMRQRDLIIAQAVFDPFFNLGATYAKNRDPSASILEVGGVATPGVVVNPSEQSSYSAGISGNWVLGTEYVLQLAQVEIDQPATSNAGITFLNPIVRTSASIDLRQPLLKGAGYGVNTAGIRIAHNNAVISYQELERITMQTVFLVEEAYWELVFANQNLDAKAKALQVTEENLANVRKKQEVGTLAPIDVTTAESQVALRKVEHEEAKFLLATNRDRLLNLINYAGTQTLRERWMHGPEKGPFDSLTVVCTSELSQEMPPFSRDEALSLAFSRRPEYRQIALNVRNQEIRRELARNELMPSLDVLARWTHLGLEDTHAKSYEELEGGRFYDWLVGLEFSVPLSNRSARSSFRNARSEINKLKLEQNDLENTIVLEVDQALREIESLVARVADLVERVRLQEELLRAERRKLEVGKSIAYTVSTIENDLVENQTQALRAQADLQTAKAELLRVTGTILEEHQISIGE